MATIGLIVKSGVEDARKLGIQLLEWCKHHGHQFVLEEQTVHSLNLQNVRGYEAQEIAKIADPIVTLGGDGTLIGVARYIGNETPTLIGVNFGNLGFLTEIKPIELLATLEEYFKGGVQFGVRALITAKVVRKNKEIFFSKAVNDVVIQKGAKDPLLNLDVFVENEEVMMLRADGLIVSTPTGSTAYSLAAGGSIVHPSLQSLLLTPICPHSLTIRPLVLPFDYTICVKTPHYEGEMFLSIDGQVPVCLESHDHVIISKANTQVKFVRSMKRSYFDILRTKLNWGIANNPHEKNK
jgi:NAD+ kinase